MKRTAAGALNGRLRAIFPDREFHIRSRGEVRFVKISSRVQIGATLVLAGLLIAWLATMVAMTFTQIAASRDLAALQLREEKAASAEHRVARYRDHLDSVASDLERRQRFIEEMVQAHIGDLPHGAHGDEDAAGAGEDKTKTVPRISGTLPEARTLARIEASQLAFVEKLTRYADRRAAAAATAIRELGLNPRTMLAHASDYSAAGGPYLSLATGKDGSIDPRFQKLGRSLARMEALEQGLAHIPQVDPASREFISSGFGYRSDPFTGEAAFHAGLDFRGPVGAPIYAAANGVVSFAGIREGYGNCVEVSHGNGLMTRYAHMSRIGSHVGQKVEAGEVIGAIGSTGRSTGPHLHFEVRIDGHPVNPRPFLEAAPHVHKEAGSTR